MYRMYRPILFNTTVHRAMYEKGQMFYMDVNVIGDAKAKIENYQQKKILNDVLEVKIPYRYKRVDCKVKGLVPVQALKKGDDIFNQIQYCGRWGGKNFWKFDLIEKIDPPREI